MTSFSLTTRRLLLRDLRPEDTASLRAYSADAEFARSMLPGQTHPERVAQKVRDSIQAAAREPRTFYGLAICLRPHSEAIGTCTAALVAEGGYAMIGWEVARPAWNQGIASEAARAVIDHLFEHHRIAAVNAHCFASNRASRRVMEKIGMRQQALRLPTAFRLMRSYRVWHPVVCYALTAERWAQARRRAA